MMFEFLNDLALGIGWLVVAMAIGLWACGSVLMVMHVVEKWFAKGR